MDVAERRSAHHAGGEEPGSAVLVDLRRDVDLVAPPVAAKDVFGNVEIGLEALERDAEASGSVAHRVREIGAVGEWRDHERGDSILHHLVRRRHGRRQPLAVEDRRDLPAVIARRQAEIDRTDLALELLAHATIPGAEARAGDDDAHDPRARVVVRDAHATRTNVLHGHGIRCDTVVDEQIDGALADGPVRVLYRDGIAVIAGLVEAGVEPAGGVGGQIARGRIAADRVVSIPSAHDVAGRIRGGVPGNPREDAEGLRLSKGETLRRRPGRRRRRGHEGGNGFGTGNTHLGCETGRADQEHGETGGEQRRTDSHGPPPRWCLNRPGGRSNEESLRRGYHLRVSGQSSGREGA